MRYISFVSMLMIPSCLVWTHLSIHIFGFARPLEFSSILSKATVKERLSFLSSGFWVLPCARYVQIALHVSYHMNDSLKVAGTGALVLGRSGLW